VPYGFIHQPAGEDEIYRLGDQAGVIQSFTGDGMSIALHSAGLAVRTHLAGGSAAAFQAELTHHISGQIRRAGLLYGCLNTPLTQSALFNAARLFPPGLALAARLTRVPARVRLSQ
jgi:flavin-dependent dehydrogenase